MDPGLILLLAIVFAVTLRMFWRPLAELAVILLLVAVFAGVIALVSASQSAFGG